MAKKSLDPAKLAALVDQGKAEARLRQPAPVSAPKEKVVVDRVPLTVKVSRDVANGLDRFQAELREKSQKPRSATSISPVVDMLLRKALGLPELDLE